MTPTVRVPPRRRHRFLVTSLVVTAGVTVAVGLGAAMTSTASAGASTTAATARADAAEGRSEALGGRADRSPARIAAPWVGTWATAMVAPGDGPAATGFTDTTLRQRLHVSVGGEVVRLRLSNAFGTAPLVVRATLARPSALPGASAADLDPASLTPVTFAGSARGVVPVGSELVSDPVRLSVPDDSDVLASLFLAGPTGPATYHPAAHATGYEAGGDRTGAVSGETFARRTGSFWFVDGLDVRSWSAGAVAVLGDSITDGSGSTTDADHRWTDDLSERLRRTPGAPDLGVLNLGIGGNRLLSDAAVAGRGDKAVDRLSRDVLTRTGVRTVVVLVGVNDLQQVPSQLDPDALVAGYRQVITRAHAQGVRVVIGTLTPFEGWVRWSPQREAVREAVNAWIRTSGEPDAVLDVDAALRDPAHPTRLRPDHDSGDHLHPGDAGYAAIADAVDLATLVGSRSGAPSPAN